MQESIGCDALDQSSSASTAEVDLDSARQFLAAISGEGALTFQILGEGKGKRQIQLLGYSSLAEVNFHKLKTLNGQGCAIAVTINESRPGSRKGEDITHVRGLFVDLDGTPLPEKWHLEPSIRVESSPGRWHAYWFVDGVRVSEFSEIQKRLARLYAGDPKICDLPRAMRVPGFLHQKGEPFTSRLLECEPGRRYARSEFLSAVPASAKPGQQGMNADPSWFSSVEEAITAMQNASTGTRNDTLNRAAFYIYGRLRDEELKEAFGRLRGAARAVGLEDADIDSTIRSAVKGRGKSGSSPKDQLLSLSADLELLKSSGDNRVYANIGGIAKGISKEGLGAWLGLRFQERFGKIVSSSDLSSVIDHLVAKAVEQGNVCDVHIRIARPFLETIYMDLGDQIVEISASGWHLKAPSDVPVRFYRPSAQLPLPEPDRDGDLSRLFEFINVRPEDRVLILTHVFGCFSGATIPGLLLQGQYASGKSTTLRVIKQLLDPDKADVSSIQRNQRDMSVYASGRFHASFDNVTEIDDHLLNAICLMCTGGTTQNRELYTNSGEYIHHLHNGIGMTCIYKPTDRTDFLSRFIIVEPPPFRDGNKRGNEKAAKKAFEEARASLLGGLLNCLSFALANPEGLEMNIRFPEAVDLTARAIQPLGFTPEELRETLERSLLDTSVETLTGSVLVGVLVRFLKKQSGPEWRGTATSLLRELNETAQYREQQHAEYPSNAPSLGRTLREITEDLGRIGIEFRDLGRTNSARLMSLRVTERFDDVFSDPDGSERGFSISVKRRPGKGLKPGSGKGLNPRPDSKKQAKRRGSGSGRADGEFPDDE